jgi:hypothetical protein
MGAERLHLIPILAVRELIREQSCLPCKLVSIPSLGREKDGAHLHKESAQIMTQDSGIHVSNIDTNEDKKTASSSGHTTKEKTGVIRLN